MTEVCPARSKRKILGLTKNNNMEASRNFAYFINDYFINAVVNGEEDLNYLETLERHNNR